MSAESDISLTAQKALRLIRLLAVAGPTFSVTEIGQHLSVPRTTASRLAAALSADGYLRKTSTGNYGLGLKFIDIAEVAVKSNDVRVAAYFEMRRLHQALGMSIHLSILDRSRDEVVRLERLRAGDLERFSTIFPADRVPLHATSSGKVHLAYRSEDEIKRFTALPLRRYTPATLVSPPDLLRELSRVRARGFAEAYDELIMGISSVAAPIFGHSGTVLAALSVSGLSEQFNPDLRPLIVQRLRAAVARVSQTLALTNLD